MLIIVTLAVVRNILHCGLEQLNFHFTLQQFNMDISGQGVSDDDGDGGSTFPTVIQETKAIEMLLTSLRGFLDCLGMAVQLIDGERKNGESTFTSSPCCSRKQNISHTTFHQCKGDTVPQVICTGPEKCICSLGSHFPIITLLCKVINVALVEF